MASKSRKILAISFAAPEGADRLQHAASLKRCPDTKLDSLTAREAVPFPKPVLEGSILAMLMNAGY